MSHLHKLFHGPSGPQDSLMAPSAAGVETVTGPPDGNSAETLRPEFAVEEAHFGPDQRIVFHTNPRSPAADRFRLLRMRLKEHWKAGKLRKLLITGPVAGEGKSTVTLNLAAALSERGKRSVLIIDADLHSRSSLTDNLGLKPWAGLTDCLVDEGKSPLSFIRRIEPFGWYFLPTGEPRKNPTELLQTPAFGHLMQGVSSWFDWIVVDSPPVIPLTDSISIQQCVDATLLVVRAEQTPREMVEQTITLLGQKNILGIVLNGVELRNRQHYQYYDHARPQEDE